MSRMNNLFRKISGDLNKKLEGTNQLVLIEGVSTKWYKERSSITCFNLEFFHQSLKHDTMDTINVSKYFAFSCCRISSKVRAQRNPCE